MSGYRVVPDGVVLAIRLTPKAARDSLDGIGRLSDGSEIIMARVRAVPADGAANNALIRLIAKALKVSKRSLRIVSGASARLKRVHIFGDAPTLAGMIEKWPRLS